MATTHDAAEAASIPSGAHSDIHFLKRRALFETEKPFAFRYDVGEQDIPQTNMEHRPHPCVVRNIRGMEGQFSLETHGFEVLEVGSAVPYEDFFSDNSIQPYLRTLEELLKKRLGASRVHAFRYAIRKRHPDFPLSTGEKYDFDQPTSVAHVDTTPDELKEYVVRLYSGEADMFRNRRYQWINVWKPLKGPLNDWPLTFCDNSNLDPGADMEAADLLYPDIATENFQIYHQEHYRWYFLAPQNVSEAIVFFQADTDPAGSPGVPHCSFFNPSVPAGEGPRESVETRLIVEYNL